MQTYLHRKNTYQKALELIHAINQTDDALVKLGITLNFDNNDTVIGSTMQVLLQNPKEIVCEALDLTLKTESAYYTGDDGRMIPISIDVYYPEDGNLEFSVTFEELWTIIDKAAEDELYTENLWKCFADKDIEARNWLKNASANGWCVH